MTPKAFQKLIWDFYAKQGRHTLPWRQNITPYRIVVSEIMLQQTQAGRVIAKFNAFTTQFPSWEKLAKATLPEVLSAWQGLGYNRRGKFLHELAKIVVKQKGLPKTPEALEELPGIGPNTARSVLAFAFNIPFPFIETNIRSVYIHHFFPKQKKVHDKELMPLIEKTMDMKNPREWYYALMDYGSFLKATTGNASRNSAHHVKQSTFKGSKRELRGGILKLYLKEKPKTVAILITLATHHFPDAKHSIEAIIADLRKEQLILL